MKFLLFLTITLISCKQSDEIERKQWVAREGTSNPASVTSSASGTQSSEDLYCFGPTGPDKKYLVMDKKGVCVANTKDSGVIKRLCGNRPLNALPENLKYLLPSCES